MTQLSIGRLYSDSVSQTDVAKLANARIFDRFYSIGPVQIHLRTNAKKIVEDYESVYALERVDRITESFVVCVEVKWQRSRRTGLGHFHISGEIDERFTVRRRSRVIPHVEGVINLSIAQMMPDFVQLHAAVLQRGDVGLLLPGGPGFGKTTLAAALIARGWRYASDEFALIDPDTGLVRAYPKALSIKPGSVNLLSAIGINFDSVPVFFRRDKGAIRSLHANHIRPDSICTTVTPRLVIFPEHKGKAKPMLETISPGQAAYDALRRCFNFPRFRQIAVETIARMCEQCECFRLESGSLNSTCDLIESLTDNASRIEMR